MGLKLIFCWNFENPGIFLSTRFSSGGINAWRVKLSDSDQPELFNILNGEEQIPFIDRFKSGLSWALGQKKVGGSHLISLSEVCY